MSKRKFQEDDDEPMLRIRLADEAGEPLQADLHLVKTCSKLCRRLPADSEVWDLSNLLIDGQPVPRETVVAWLNKAHRTGYGRGALFQQQEPDPCKTFTGLYQLLAFADAVESAPAVMDTCVAQLDGLQLHAQLGEQRLQLETDGRAYCFFLSGPLQLRTAPLTTIHAVGSPAANEAEVAAFKGQAAAQTEQLLFMAYKLQLAPLIERLHGFVASCVALRGSVFIGQEQAVFSERVLDAAVGDNRLGRQAWVDSVVLEERCALVAGDTPGRSQLLRPLDLTEEQKRPVKFKAELTRDFMGAAKGTVVNVNLDLFEGKIQIGVVPTSVQLVLGVSVDRSGALL